MQNSWNHIVNELLHGLTYTEAITAETVDWIADSAVNYTALRSGPDAYQHAIREALASGQPLDGLDLLPQFDQVQLTDFLRAVDARLDALRPWPEPDFREIDPSEAGDFLGGAVPIATVRSSILALGNAFRTVFRPIGVDPRREAIVLSLRTGDTVALLATFEPTETITLLTGRDDDAARVLENFVAATGVPKENLTPL